MKEQYFPAAACIVKNKRLLLLHRNVEGVQVWELPGGRIEFGESPEKAAVREAKEETGLTVKNTGLLTINSNVNKKGIHHIWFLYNCKIIRGKVGVKDDDHDEYRWFTYEELKNRNDIDFSIKCMLHELKKVLE